MSLTLDLGESGTIRLPADLSAELNEAAEREGIEPSTFAVAALRRAVQTNGTAQNGHAPHTNGQLESVVLPRNYEDEMPALHPDGLPEGMTLAEGLMRAFGIEDLGLDTPRIRTRTDALKEGFDD